MTDATDAARTPLQLIGDDSAAVCEGDFCALPERHTQAAVNRQVDLDAV